MKKIKPVIPPPERKSELTKGYNFTIKFLASAALISCLSFINPANAEDDERKYITDPFQFEENGSGGV